MCYFVNYDYVHDKQLHRITTPTRAHAHLVVIDVVGTINIQPTPFGFLIAPIFILSILLEIVSCDTYSKLIGVNSVMNWLILKAR